jgi:hypothetical protein
MNKQFKPVLVKIMTGKTIEEVRAFDTLKLAYTEYAGELTYRDYHSFRGTIFPKSNHQPYNVVSLLRIQDKLQVASVEWITPEEAMSLLKNKTQVETLRDNNFFEFRGQFGHLINKGKPKVKLPKIKKVSPDDIPSYDVEDPLESTTTPTPEPVEVVVDVEKNKAAFEAAFKSLRNIFHSKHVGYTTIKNRFEAKNLPGFPAEITDEIREIAFLAWASDKTPSPEQTALLGFKE